MRISDWSSDVCSADLTAMAEPTTHYEVLGVGRGATTAELRAAYVELARIHHPDRAGGDAARMRAVNAAWATLRNPARRAAYDASIAGWPAGASDRPASAGAAAVAERSEEHTSELQSLMRTSYAVFCLKKKK